MRHFPYVRALANVKKGAHVSLSNSGPCWQPPDMTAWPFIDELRRLPADRLEEAAAFIHTLLAAR
ncbi:hypothetical protein [Prosthecobacter sp.]|jgi:hypothetical protein|uniref:hypothetical protein n=1 Tax=Prosthecobacter sp. TaxID=1965333 RepID=UPI003784ABC3